MNKRKTKSSGARGAQAEKDRDGFPGRVVPPRAWRNGHTAALARRLLGCRLVRRHPDGRREARAITEVEAYHGESDLACHASKGRTARTEVLYGASGIWYVYLCYGIHEMLNLVVGPPGHPAAILIRGIEGIHGPGRLTRALGIGRTLNGRPAARASGLWIEKGWSVPRREVEASPRVGIDYAGPIWSAKPWRFTWRKPAAGSPPGSRGRTRS